MLSPIENNTDQQKIASIDQPDSSRSQIIDKTTHVCISTLLTDEGQPKPINSHKLQAENKHGEKQHSQVAHNDEFLNEEEAKMQLSFSEDTNGSASSETPSSVSTNSTPATVSTLGPTWESLTTKDRASYLPRIAEEVEKAHKSEGMTDIEGRICTGVLHCQRKEYDAIISGTQRTFNFTSVPGLDTVPAVAQFGSEWRFINKPIYDAYKKAQKELGGPPPTSIDGQQQDLEKQGITIGKPFSAAEARIWTQAIYNAFSSMQAEAMRRKEEELKQQKRDQDNRDYSQQLLENYKKYKESKTESSQNHKAKEQHDHPMPTKGQTELNEQALQKAADEKRLLHKKHLKSIEKTREIRRKEDKASDRIADNLNQEKQQSEINTENRPLTERTVEYPLNNAFESIPHPPNIVPLHPLSSARQNAFRIRKFKQH